MRNLELRAPREEARHEPRAGLERARAPGARAVRRTRRDRVAVDGRVAPLKGDDREARRRLVGRRASRDGVCEASGVQVVRGD